MGNLEGNESRTLLKQGSLFTVAAAAPVLVTVLVTPALTRVLGADEYGIVGLTQVILQLGIVLLSFGIQEPIARHGIMEPSGLRGATWIALALMVPSVLLAAVAIITTQWWVPALLHTPNRPAFSLTVVTAMLYGIIGGFQAVMRAANRPGPFVVMAMLASFIAPVLGLAAVLLVDRSADLYLVGMVVGYLVSFAYGVTVLLRTGRPRHAPRDFRKAFRLGLPMIPNQVAVYLATAAIVGATSQLLGVADAGRVQLTLYVGTAPAIIAIAISNSWSPILYRTAAERRTEVATQLASDVATVIAVLCCGLVALLPFVLPLLMPATFEPEGLVAAASLSCIGSILLVVYLANVHLMMAAGRNGSLVVIVPGAVVLGIAPVLLLGGVDVLDLVAAFPLTMGLMALGTRVALPNASPSSWSLRAVLPQVTAVMIAGVIGMILPPSGISTAIRLIMACAAGVVGLAFLRRTLMHPRADSV